MSREHHGTSPYFTCLLTSLPCEGSSWVPARQKHCTSHFPLLSTLSEQFILKCKCRTTAPLHPHSLGSSQSMQQGLVTGKEPAYLSSLLGCHHSCHPAPVPPRVPPRPRQQPILRFASFLLMQLREEDV